MHKAFLLLLVLPIEKRSFSDKIAILRKKAMRREWFVERREKTRRSQFCRIRTELEMVQVMVVVAAIRKGQVTQMRQE